QAATPPVPAVAQSGADAPAATEDVAGLQKALKKAQKQAANEQLAREEAEQAAKVAGEQLAKEQTAKNAAWRVIGQLTKQLKQAGIAPSDATDTGSAPKKARGRAKAKAPADNPAGQ
ncbi:MAG: hypothetical protein J2P50_17615, partial [Hyphomicrobiaceae bacterium]|nr:hypothetical protein [Hyphomicrobiaceae bacterium]